MNMSRPVSDRRPTGETHRTRLLLAAQSLLRERAYGKITARDLVTASNTNLGSISYHFGSKEALFLGLVEGMCRAGGRTPEMSDRV